VTVATRLRVRPWADVLVRGRPWADVLGSWAAARLVVLGALGLAAFLGLPKRMDLLGWDAVHYLFIADHGYQVSAPNETRFFPLVPLMTRALAVLPGVSTAAALLLIANVGAVVFALLVHRLARDEGLGRDGAGRAVWLLTLAPPAFVLVMGYAESVFGALAVVYAGSVRRGAWGRAAAAGFLAGTCRPVALAVVAFGLVEAARGLRGAGPAEVLRRLAAVAAPAAGIAVYLAYIGARTGSPLLPFTVQSKSHFRGSIVSDPISGAVHNAEVALTGQSIGSGLHVVWLLIYLALLVVVARTLPAGYTALAAVTLFLAATSHGMNSLERYAWSAFPFTLALAAVTGRPWVFRLVLTVSAALLLGYALLAFASRYTP
jgi:hypothetical protein